MRALAVMLLASLLLAGCGQRGDVSTMSGATHETAFVTDPGLVARVSGTRFINLQGRDRTNNVACKIEISNQTKKCFKKFKVRVTVKWTSPPDQVQKEFEYEPGLVYGGFVKGVVPPGRHAFSEWLKIPITDDQWRLDYVGTVELLGAVEHDPARDPTHPINWQLAALNGNEKEMLSALEARPELAYETNEQGYTLMSLAIIGGNVEKVKALEGKGFVLDDVIRSGRTPVHLSAFSTPEMVRYVASKKIKYSVDNDGYYPIAYSVFARRRDVMEALIEAGHSLDLADCSGNSVFMIAIQNNQTDLVKMLGDRGVRTDRYSDHDKGPLAFAIFKGSEMLDLVAKYDKKVKNPSPRFNMTLLHHAVLDGSPDAAKWCVDHGVDRNIKDSLGRKPEDYLYLIQNEMDRMRMQAAIEGHW